MILIIYIYIIYLIIFYYIFFWGVLWVNSFFLCTMRYSRKKKPCRGYQSKKHGNFHVSIPVKIEREKKECIQAGQGKEWKIHENLRVVALETILQHEGTIFFPWKSNIGCEMYDIKWLHDDIYFVFSLDISIPPHWIRTSKWNEFIWFGFVVTLGNSLGS